MKLTAQQLADERKAFEGAVGPAMLLGAPELVWVAERNCYAECYVNFAWKAWRLRAELAHTQAQAQAQGGG